MQFLLLSDFFLNKSVNDFHNLVISVEYVQVGVVKSPSSFGDIVLKFDVNLLVKYEKKNLHIPERGILFKVIFF